MTYARHSTHVALQWIAACILAIALGACSTGAQVVDHAFAFNAVSDSPDIQILDYRYGDSQIPTASNPERLRLEGRSPQAASVQGPMKRGDFLYVKWRIRTSGEILERTVDLRSRLPADIADHHVYFIVRGPQLYVYLISPERRPPEVPPIGPRVYQHLRTITIYPDKDKS